MNSLLTRAVLPVLLHYAVFLLQGANINNSTMRIWYMYEQPNTCNNHIIGALSFRLKPYKTYSTILIVYGVWTEGLGMRLELICSTHINYKHF